MSEAMKPILDPCCGSRMFWFDKQNPHVLYGDIRQEQHELCDGRQLIIDPDMHIDFTDMPFEDESFHLVGSTHRIWNGLALKAGWRRNTES